LILKHKSVLTRAKKKPTGAEYRKRRAQREHGFEECKKSINLQKYFAPKSTGNGTCEQGEASAFISPKNRFKLGVTTVDCSVKELPECQSDYLEVLQDTETPHIPMINLSDPALWPKVCDKSYKSPKS
jgi:hypothetical protein